MIEVVEYEEPDGNVEQAKAHHGETHHGTRTEGNLEATVETLACCIGGTARSIGGGLHAKEACQTTEETTGEEGKRHPRILGIEAVGHDGKDDGKDDEHDEHDLVLLLQISHGALADILGNLAHTRCTLVCLHHAAKEYPCHHQSDDGCDGHNPKDNGNVFHKINIFVVKRSLRSLRGLRGVEGFEGFEGVIRPNDLSNLSNLSNLT